MAKGERRETAVSDSSRKIPADLAAVVVLTVLLLGAVSLPGVRETPLRIVLGVPFTLIAPGYAIVATLFPEAGGSRSEAGDSGVDGLERVAFSIGLSIVVVPLCGLALTFTPWGIRLVPVVLVVAAVTVVATVAAAWRRRALPSDEQFRAPLGAWYRAGRDEFLAPDSRADVLVNAVLIVSLLVAVTSVAYAVTIPPDDEQFTELYLVSEDDGNLTAADYPDQFVRGEGQSVVLGIENHEDESVEYTVVVQLQRVDVAANDSRVTERQRLDRLNVTLGPGETAHREHEITPEMTGENLRVQYLLYRGEPPAEPTAENAYRSVHLWIDVEERSAAE